MIGKTVSHYEIISRLGGGGMGVVYKAYDTALKRHVALKFLPADLTRDEAARKRFTHEAQAAAALDHPNICTVHEIGQSDGNSFIVMPLVEGESLREKLERGPLPVDEALDLALQVGRGLSKAHGSGIVHRDIKPANVLLTTDGQAKIVDFGLAKLGTQTKLTKTGMTVGTVGYMSPEQAKGEEVDQRTDVWSLGVMLYEMLAGRLPFRGEMDAAMVYSILNEEPSPVTSVRQEVPVALEDVVERALSKDTTKRYQTIDEMLAELERVAEESRLGIERKRYAAIKRLKRRKRLITGTAAVLVVAIAAILLTTFYQRSQALDSIAVLPFENLSGADSLDLYANVVTCELIANFNRVGAFTKVIARSTSMYYRGTDKSPKQLADELGVKALVMGVVQIQGDDIKITPELIKGDSGELLWSDTFDGKTRDILSLQGQIARSVADEVHVTLTPEEKDLLAVERPPDPEAYEAYVLGMNYSEVLTSTSIQNAVKWYNRAIQIDSTFAAPYAALAIIYGHLYGNFDQAEALALKAEEIDPRLPEIHIARAAVYMTRDWDWERANREIEKAEQLASVPCNVHALDRVYMLRGQMDQAIECDLNDVRSDPMNPIPAAQLIWTYQSTSRPQGAINAARKVLERFPDHEEAVADAWNGIIHAYAMMGQTDSSFAIAERLDTEVGDQVYAAAGMLEPIQKALEEQLKKWEESEKTDWRLVFNIARTYGFLGEDDKAFEWLEKAYEMRAWSLMYLNPSVAQGQWDNLLEDPRLADLMRRIGLPPTAISVRLVSMKKYGLL